MQLVSAPDCGSGCRGFESHYPPFYFKNRINVNGLSPSGKAQDFDSCSRWFESSHPSHTKKGGGSRPSLYFYGGAAGFEGARG